MYQVKESTQIFISKTAFFDPLFFSFFCFYENIKILIANNPILKHIFILSKISLSNICFFCSVNIIDIKNLGVAISI